MYKVIPRPKGRAALFAGTRGNYYDLGDGKRIDVETTPVWCHRCGGIRHGESIEPVGEIDQQLADLRNPRSKLYQLYAQDYLEECKDLGPHFCRGLIEALRLRRRWRENRVSPPKCIHCGSTDLVVFPINQPVPHPAGQGSIEVRITGMCSTYFNEWFFTPEGDRIPLNTKPTYWHFPGKPEWNRPGSGVEWLRKHWGEQGRCVSCGYKLSGKCACAKCGHTSDSGS